MAEKEKKPGIFARMARSVRDMRGELKKVVWPTRKQIVNNTLIVLAFVAVCSVIIGGFDTLLTFVLRFATNAF